MSQIQVLSLVTLRPMSKAPAAAAEHKARPRSARNQRRRARTRAALIDAAEVVFRRDGFHAARVEDIAEQADVAVGTIYVHFSGKRALYMALVERALDLFEQYMASSEDPTLSPFEQVLAGGKAYLRFHNEHPELFLLLALGNAGRDHADPDDEITAQIAARTRVLLDRFAARIDAAVAAGEARNVDSRVLTNYLWGAWNGVVALRMQPEGVRLSPDDVNETLALALSLLRAGLSTAPPPNEISATT